MIFFNFLILDINNILSFIGSFRLFGIIPLDIIAHLSISTIITIALRKLKSNYYSIILIISILGITKEIYDSTIVECHILEHVKDMCINITFPIISFFINEINKQD